MARKLVGYEAVQVREDDRLLTGYLEVDPDGVVRFTAQDAQELQANEQVKGRLGEFEEVETPVPADPDA